MQLLSLRSWPPTRSSGSAVRRLRQRDCRCFDQPGAVRIVFIPGGMLPVCPDLLEAVGDSPGAAPPVPSDSDVGEKPRRRAGSHEDGATSPLIPSFPKVDRPQRHCTDAGAVTGRAGDVARSTHPVRIHKDADREKEREPIMANGSAPIIAPASGLANDRQHRPGHHQERWASTPRGTRRSSSRGPCPSSSFVPMGTRPRNARSARSSRPLSMKTRAVQTRSQR